ncbi:GspE/PulE family protein [Paracoccus litorisediminis]|uniref:GspE/PulE family protein n=1 Tax=Paracoccus litorisediminis TaxID=2006130 RepID=UPI0037313873
MRELVLSAIEGAELLSGGSALYPVQLTEPQKRKVAFYSNGTVLHLEEFRWVSEFKSIENKARLKNIRIENFLAVSVAELDEIYAAEKTPEAVVAPVLELERQQELRDMIDRASREGASDIVIRIVRGHTEVRTRVFGRMKDTDSRSEGSGAALILAAFAVASDQGTSSSIMSFMQGALTPKSGLLPPRVEMIRLQYSPTSEGRGALVMRLKYVAPANEVEINHLGYNSQQIEDITTMRKRTNGLYILAGKVSSGKSTTLQRVLNKMFFEKHREISMYTIEEPVELDLPGAIQVPAKKNPDGTDGFEGAMKASLRSDPNIIVLGEIRSKDLAYLAIQAVMTGHALWSTVHAGTALGILDRLTDLGVEGWKLADPTIVRGLVYQRLTGVLCPHCRITLLDGVRKKSVDLDLAKKLSALFQKHPEKLYVRGDGCQHCKLGLSGRTVVAETVLTDPRMLELFSKGDRVTMRQYWLDEKSKGGLGGIPVLHHALSKVGAGICDINEVEEEVDLFSVYEREYMHLQPRLLRDVALLDEQEEKKRQKLIEKMNKGK